MDDLYPLLIRFHVEAAEIMDRKRQIACRLNKDQATDLLHKLAIAMHLKLKDALDPRALLMEFAEWRLEQINHDLRNGGHAKTTVEYIGIFLEERK